MKPNRISLTVIIIINVFLFSCRESKTKNIKYENENIYIKQKASVIHRKITTLNAILGNTVDVSNKVVFIYNGLDCETCIDIGYSISKRIDKIKNKKFVFVITTSTSIGREQLRNKYLEYVFYDEHDLIRKELKYIFTPAVILFDKEKRIKLVYYPGLENEDEGNNFINNCFKQ